MRVQERSPTRCQQLRVLWAGCRWTAQPTRSCRVGFGPGKIGLELVTSRRVVLRRYLSRDLRRYKVQVFHPSSENSRMALTQEECGFPDHAGWNLSVSSLRQGRNLDIPAISSRRRRLVPPERPRQGWDTDMSQNATPQDTATETEPCLSQQQVVALQRLAGGDTVTAAAQAAGVARETVHRWLRDDAAFLTTLNRAKAEIRDAAERTLLVVVQQATANLMNAVEGGNLQASVAVLKDLAFSRAKSPRSVPPIQSSSQKTEGSRRSRGGCRSVEQAHARASLEMLAR